MWVRKWVREGVSECECVFVLIFWEGVGDDACFLRCVCVCVCVCVKLSQYTNQLRPEHAMGFGRRGDVTVSRR